MRFRLACCALLVVSCVAISAVPQPIPKSSDAPPVKGDPTPAEPMLTGDDTAEFMAEMSIKGVPTGSAVVWDVSPEESVRIKIIKSEKALVFGGQPATYTVKARITKGEDVTADLRKTVTITGRKGPLPPPVPPGPGPGPGPQPQPVPTGTIGSFVVVEDTTKAGPWRGTILGSPAVEAWYRQVRGNRTGLIHTLVDINDPTATPEFAQYATAAAGKDLPYAFILDPAGKTIKQDVLPVKDVPSFLAFFNIAPGEERAMGCILAAPKLKWTEFGSTPNTPIIPRAQWPKVHKLSTYLPGVYDQDGIGQCASSSACTTVELAAYLRGIPYPKLSAGDLYSRVNGGRDNGSTLEDNLQELLTNGVAPASMVPYVWDRRKHTDAATVAARKKYRVVEAYWCPSFDAMVSASLQGFSVGTGLMWFNNFKPDAAGWLPVKGAGQAGGHALAVYGVEQRADGVIGVWVRNSWTAQWGFAGDCCIPESLFSGQITGFYAVRVVTSPTAVSRLEQPFGLVPEFAIAW